MLDSLLNSKNIKSSIEIIKKMPCYLFVKDTEHRFITCSNYYAAKLGLTDPDCIQGLFDNDLPWNTDENEKYLADDRQVMRTKSAMLNRMETQTESDITQVIVTNKYPLCDEQGHCQGILGMFYYLGETPEDLTLSAMFQQSTDARQLQLQCGKSIDLSTQAIKVASNLALGYSTQAIATMLNLSPRTVEAYTTQLKERTGVASKDALVRALLHSNLVSLY